jgi:hypothetical protein
VWERGAPRQPIILARADSLGFKDTRHTPVQMGTREPRFAPLHDPPIAGNLNCFWRTPRAVLAPDLDLHLHECPSLPVPVLRIDVLFFLSATSCHPGPLCSLPRQPARASLRAPRISHSGQQQPSTGARDQERAQETGEARAASRSRRDEVLPQPAVQCSARLE